MNKNNFRQSLNDLINVKIKSPWALATYFVSQNLFYKRKAQAIHRQFKEYNNSIVSQGIQSVNVNILPYEGSNSFVLRMKSLLNSQLKDDLRDVIVHGSLGNYDAINYSDFDGLVIIKDEVLKNPLRLARVAWKLSETRQIMYDMDPLQHHGWFLLTEGEFRDYDDTYFPAEIFNYSKSILHEKSYSILITYSSKVNYKDSFNALCTAILKSLRTKNKISNMYQLKSILSRFMLLPSLYYQAENKKVIFKKNSFEEVIKDFTLPEWKIMNEVSQLRKEWLHNCSPLQKKIIKKFYYLHHKMIQPFYPGIPPALKQKLNDKFFMDMRIFTEIMQLKIRSQL